MTSYRFICENSANVIFKLPVMYMTQHKVTV